MGLVPNIPFKRHDFSYQKCRLRQPGSLHPGLCQYDQIFGRRQPVDNPCDHAAIPENTSLLLRPFTAESIQWRDADDKTCPIKTTWGLLSWFWMVGTEMWPFREWKRTRRFMSETRVVLLNICKGNDSQSFLLETHRAIRWLCMRYWARAGTTKTISRNNDGCCKR